MPSLPLAAWPWHGPVSKDAFNRVVTTLTDSTPGRNAVAQPPYIRNVWPLDMVAARTTLTIHWKLKSGSEYHRNSQYLCYADWFVRHTKCNRKCNWLIWRGHICKTKFDWSNFSRAILEIYARFPVADSTILPHCLGRCSSRFVSRRQDYFAACFSNIQC